MTLKPKVVVIFPRYSDTSASHYPYWYKLFEQVDNQLDLVVLFESGTDDHKLKLQHAIFQKIQFKPFNLVERFYLLLIFRLKGYKHFYTHYSYFSLFLAKIITSILGGKTYLWDCEYYTDIPQNIFQRFALRLTDILVTGHQKIADQYKKIIRTINITKIVNNWVNSEKSNYLVDRQNSKYINILFVHHISPRKGSRQLPKIIKNIVIKNKKVRFIIVGDGHDLFWLKEQIKKLNLNKYVIFKGKLSGSRIKSIWKMTDIFIMPSIQEGFPRVILESQKYGIPYVSTNVGCVKEISPEIELEYIVNLDKFVLAIHKLINKIQKDNYLIQLHKELIKNAQYYNLKNSSKQFIRLFT